MNDRVRTASRVIFIDLARALAVVLMVSGHTSSALLAMTYRTGPWVHAWDFQRGLTSALFLLLAGFAFSVATTRHWATHLQLSAVVVRRVRRFLLFVALGYVLHFPVPRLALLGAVDEAKWRSFLAVDVLQLIGLTLVAVQVLVLAARSRRAFAIASFGLAIGIVAASPFMWASDWSTRVPAAVAAYLSPATGSQFPLFPWSAYVFIGAGAGQLYARWGAAHLGSFAAWGMAIGVALIAAALSVEGGIPGDVAIRTGACFLVLGAIAHLSRYVVQLPHVFGAVAQESLLVYFVHLCIVYGSIWNAGLATFYGTALGPAATAAAVAAVVLVMIALALQWNRLKHAQPRLARRLSLATAVVLTVWLI